MIAKRPSKSRKYKLDTMPPAWQETIIRMRMRGKGLKSIQNFMSKEYKMSISLGALSPWLKKQLELPPNALFSKEKYVRELEAVYISNLKRFDKLALTAWDIVEDMKRTARDGSIRDKAEVLKGIAELRMLTELSAKLLNDLPKSSDDVMEALKKAQVMASHLSKKGLLKDLEDKKKERMDDAESRAIKLAIPGGSPVTVYDTQEQDSDAEDL